MSEKVTLLAGIARSSAIAAKSSPDSLCSAEQPILSVHRLLSADSSDGQRAKTKPHPGIPGPFRSAMTLLTAMSTPTCHEPFPLALSISQRGSREIPC